MLDRSRLIDERRHSCGCRTAFDTQDWRSVTLGQCAEHLAVTEAHGIDVRPRGNGSPAP